MMAKSATIMAHSCCYTATPVAIAALSRYPWCCLDPTHTARQADSSQPSTLPKKVEGIILKHTSMTKSSGMRSPPCYFLPPFFKRKKPKKSLRCGHFPPGEVTTKTECFDLSRPRSGSLQSSGWRNGQIIHESQFTHRVIFEGHDLQLRWIS